MAKKKKASKRIKAAEPLLYPIHDFKEADEHIKRIGQLQDRIAAHEQRCKTTIEQAKALEKQETAPLHDQIALRLKSLQAFADARPGEFKTTRSRKLTFGRIGYRKSTSYVYASAKKTLQLIKETLTGERRKACINIKETVSKDGLARLTDEQLKAVAARRKSTDVFFVEPLKNNATDYSDG